MFVLAMGESTRWNVMTKGVHHLENFLNEMSSSPLDILTDASQLTSIVCYDDERKGQYVF